MINNKYLVSFLSSLLQTLLYSFLLMLAYLYWTVPNAGLIIGTAFSIVLLFFFIFALIQNLLILSRKNDAFFIVFIIIGVLMVLPYAINFTWLSPILILLNAMILYIPVLVRKYFWIK